MPGITFEVTSQTALDKKILQYAARLKAKRKTGPKPMDETLEAAWRVLDSFRQDPDLDADRVVERLNPGGYAAWGRQSWFDRVDDQFCLLTGASIADGPGFVFNPPGRTREDYLRLLQDVGIPARPAEDVFRVGRGGFLKRHDGAPVLEAAERARKPRRLRKGDQAIAVGDQTCLPIPCDLGALLEKLGTDPATAMLKRYGPSE